MTKTILVAGALANRPGNGGGAWVRSAWVRGLRRLGFDARLVEQVDAAGADGTAFFDRAVRQLGLEGAAVLVDARGRHAHGMPYDDLLHLAESAALLVNLGGHLTLAPLLRRLRRKAYVDLDPGFTQIWEATGVPGAHLEGHDDYFTVGENVGTASCPIPTNGLRWRPTRPPVVLDDWPDAGPAPFTRFTTVGTWRGPYGPLTHDGRTYGLKVHEFRRFMDLPRRTPCRFELALDIHPADGRDRRALLAAGWHLVDPAEAAADPHAYRRYVQGSGAECSAAQGVYVATQSGWVSDRTVRYLASGRPALVQDTGFTRNLPSGCGLVPFRTLAEARDGARRITADYAAHCEAARALAEAHFDSDEVLGRFAEEVGLAP